MQAKLQEQIPALDTCEEAIPAVVFGTYDFPLGSTLQVCMGGMGAGSTTAEPRQSN